MVSPLAFRTGFLESFHQWDMEPLLSRPLYVSLGKGAPGWKLDRSRQPGNELFQPVGNRKTIVFRCGLAGCSFVWVWVAWCADGCNLFVFQEPYLITLFPSSHSIFPHNILCYEFKKNIQLIVQISFQANALNDICENQCDWLSSPAAHFLSTTGLLWSGRSDFFWPSPLWSVRGDQWGYPRGPRPRPTPRLYQLHSFF